MEKVIIIGGGPSGIVAGIFAKRNNNEVIILERNSKPLKKLLMTGNGKCNFFNEVYGDNCYYSEDKDIVSQIISSDNIKLVENFFDSLGIIYKVKNGYYYPFSNQASTFAKALLDFAKYKGVKIICDSLVTDIKKKKSSFFVTCLNKNYKCDKLILATGSKAYSNTGSDGRGYSFLKRFSHKIIEPVPALVPLVISTPIKEWAGVRTDVELELFENGEFLEKEDGEIQLTSYGISGICTFNLSHVISRGLALKKTEVVKINFVPFIKTLISPWMHQYSKKHSEKNLGDLLEGFLNYKLVLVILKKCGLSKFSFYQDLKNEDKLLLCKNLRSFPVEIIGTKGFDSAQVCNGGVKLSEIDVQNMESRKVPNLYVVGELLDINGKCGGYNLTTCWITGMLAGRSIGGNCD